MASAPPPPNPSRDSDRLPPDSSEGQGQGSDIEADGPGIITRGAQAVTSAVRSQVLPRNVNRGVPPINPNLFESRSYSHHNMPQFNQYVMKGDTKVYNIVNSQNVQIGHTNIMNVQHSNYGNAAPGNHGEPSYHGSDSEEEADQKNPALEDARLVELRNSDREVNNQELLDLSKHIGMGWRRLMRNLGLQDYDLDDVYEENSSRGLEEVKYQLLKRWTREAEHPTVSEMLYQLDRCQMSELAQYLQTDGPS